MLTTECFEFKVTIMERYLEYDNPVFYKIELLKMLDCIHSLSFPNDNFILNQIHMLHQTVARYSYQRIF